jgi:hypothetical protein
MRKIEVPNFLSHLKIDERGYPIPFFVAYVNGKPDFRMLEVTKQKQCVEKKLCSICGKKLFEYQYFITGPMGLKNGTHSDPPSHRECAEYSMNICPHLYFEKADRNDRGEIYKESAAQNTTGIMHKSKELYLIKSDKYKLVRVPEGHILQFRKVSWEKYIYLNGILTKENS